MESFSKRVYDIVKQIPKGKVTTYKQVAQAMNMKCYRAVGLVLSKNTNPEVPCHRVVRSDLKVGGFRGSKDNQEKIILLLREGVDIKGDKVNKKSLLNPSYFIR